MTVKPTKFSKDFVVWRIINESKVAAYRDTNIYKDILEKTTNQEATVLAVELLTKSITTFDVDTIPKIFESADSSLKAAIINSAGVKENGPLEDLLVSGLESDDIELQFSSVTKLRDFSTKKQHSYREKLIKLLGSPCDKVRSSTVALIGWWHDPKDFHHIINVAKNDDNARVKTNALEALTNYLRDNERSKELISVISDCIEDDNHRLATTAAALYYPFAKETADYLLKKFIKSNLELRRAAAAWAMGQTGDYQNYTEILLESIQTEDVEMPLFQMARALAVFCDIKGEITPTLKSIMDF